MKPKKNTTSELFFKLLNDLEYWRSKGMVIGKTDYDRKQFKHRLKSGKVPRQRTMEKYLKDAGYSIVTPAEFPREATWEK